MIKREAFVFLIVGSVTVLVDFLTYRGLTGLSLDYRIAKVAGFIMGTVFAYFANRFWTFGHNTPASGSALRFTLLYAITMGTNVGVNSLLLTMLGAAQSSILVAFLIATAVSASLNFIGMKWFVFKSAAPRPS